MSDRFVLFIGDETFPLAGHFDAFTMRRSVCHGDEIFGGNVCLLIESQEPAIGHRHVNGNDQIALCDDDGCERMSFDNRSILVAAEFGSLCDPLALHATAGIDAQRNRGHRIGECGFRRGIHAIAVDVIALDVPARVAMGDGAALQYC